MCGIIILSHRQAENNRLKYVADGFIKTDPKMPIAERLALVYKTLAQVIETYHPDEAAIERFVSEERSKMQKEYESLDNGDCSSNIYHTPTDWEGIASEMKEQEVEQEDEMSM